MPNASSFSALLVDCIAGTEKGIRGCDVGVVPSRGILAAVLVAAVEELVAACAVVALSSREALPKKAGMLGEEDSGASGSLVKLPNASALTGIGTATLVVLETDTPIRSFDGVVTAFVEGWVVDDAGAKKSNNRSSATTCLGALDIADGL